MPIEGLPAQPDTPDADAQTTTDESVKNTGADAEGAGTDTAQQNQATKTEEKTFTQADVDRIVQNRLKSAVKAELKKLVGDGEPGQTLEDLQRQLSDSRNELQGYRSRDAVRDFISDKNNKLNVSPENVRGIEALVTPLLTFTDGKPDNLPEAFNSAKIIAPALFVNSTAANINQGSGRNGHVPTNDMNALIRQMAGGN